MMLDVEWQTALGEGIDIVQNQGAHAVMDSRVRSVLEPS